VLISLYRIRYEKLAIRYDLGPGALSMETLVHDLLPAGREFKATALLTASWVVSNEGAISVGFFTDAIGMPLVRAYPNSTYPIELREPLRVFATPSLSDAPTPIGHGTDLIP